MDYKPHYLQPFTPSEAIALDVSVITQEIVRLQNSLEHLRQTQEGLREYLASESLEDPEIAKALEENELVIGSQEERISILKMALMEKGVHAGSHYDKSDPTSTLERRGHGSAATTTNVSSFDNEPSEESGGIHL